MFEFAGLPGKKKAGPRARFLKLQHLLPNHTAIRSGKWPVQTSTDPKCHRSQRLH